MKQHNVLAYIAFVVLGLSWGSTFVFVKIANEYISAEQIAFYRPLFGLLIIAIYAFATKGFKREHIKYTHHFVVMAILGTVMHFLFFAKGTALLHSGIAGALSGSIPIFTFVLSALFLRDEKSTLMKLGGIFLGLIGVILIANPFNDGVSGPSIAGISYLLLGCAAVGGSFVYTKKYISSKGISAAALTTYQLAIGMLIMIPMIDFKGAGNVWNDTTAAITTVLGLGLINTGIAFIAYYYIVEKLGAIRASSVTYLPPIIAMFIAVVLIDEDITFMDFVATGLIFFGMILMREKTPENKLN